MSLLMGWLEEASSKLCAECWDMNSGEHTHKETEGLYLKYHGARDIRKKHKKTHKDSWAGMDLNSLLRGLMELRNPLRKEESG